MLRTSEGIFPSGCLIGWVITRGAECSKDFPLVPSSEWGWGSEEISLWYLQTSRQSLCTTEVLTVPMNCVMEIRQMARSGHKIIVPLHHISQRNRWPNTCSSSPNMWCRVSNLDLSLCNSVVWWWNKLEFCFHFDCFRTLLYSHICHVEANKHFQKMTWEVQISADVQIYDCGVSKIWTYERGVTPRMAAIRSSRQPTTLITRISHPPGFLMPTFWGFKTQAGFCR